MFTENLYKEILYEPADSKNNQLDIISGYATAAMADRHLHEVLELNQNLKVNLIIGMPVVDGLPLANHQAFKKLMREDYDERFTCSYIYRKPPIHSKAYIWRKDGEFVTSFIGSANYTQNGFWISKKELMCVYDKNDIVNYFEYLVGHSCYCTHPEIEEYITFYDDKKYKKTATSVEQETSALLTSGLEQVTVSLLVRNEEMPKRSGLNWGHRDNRNRNQAYIQLPPSIYRSSFFPEKPQQFTVYTDDNMPMIFTRAQKTDQGTALETPRDNSELGLYFRNRLGLESGAFITKQDLINYGRTDVTFYKIDDETYSMDFSVS